MQEIKIKKSYLIIGAVVIFALAGFLFIPKFAQNSAKEGLNVGQLAPDFTLQDPVNGEISKITFQGKPLFIFFTKTWWIQKKIKRYRRDDSYQQQTEKQ